MFTLLLKGYVRSRVTALVMLLAVPAMAGWASAGDAQEMSAPVDVQVALLPRILQFDRRFPDGLGDEMVVGILYQGRFRASFEAMTAARAALERERANGSLGSLALLVVALDWDEGLSLADALAEREIDVLYVAPVRAVEIRGLARISRDQQVLTFTGVPDYVGLGISVGIGSRRGRPEILINPEAAAAEGARFSSELLKIVQIVDGSVDGMDASEDEAVR